jgi:hypothetical protein
MMNLAKEWVMSLDNPTRARIVADRLWRTGVHTRKELIALGYNEYECNILIDRFIVIMRNDFDW